MKLSYKYPFVTFPKASDCVICALTPIFFISILFCYECPHTTKGVLKPKVKTTKFRLFLYVLINWAILFSWICYLYKWSKGLQEARGIFFDIFDIMKQLWITSVYYSFMSNRHTFVKYMNGTTELLWKRKRFGLDSLLPAREVERMQYRLLYIILLSYLFFTWISISRLMSVQLNISSLTEISSFQSLTLGLILYVYVILLLDIYNQIFKTLIKSIRQELDLRSCNSEKNLSVFTYRSSFVDRLRLYQHFYMSCILNYSDLVMVFFNLFVSIGIFILNVFCQTFCFLALCFYISYEESVKEEVIVEITVAIFCILNSYRVLEKAQENYEVSDDLISYIHKYRISQLTLEESQLVESLKITLIKHKPSLHASALFEVKRRLVPSIIGHVITYGLMAMQFNTLSSGFSKT